MATAWTRICVLAVLRSAATSPASAQNRLPLQAVNRAFLDTTCAPCKDFYRFANGAWLDSVTIPPGETEWGQLRALRRDNNQLVRQILDSLAFAPARHARAPVERQLGTFYRACLADVPDSVGIRALLPELRRIETIRTPNELAEEVGRLQRYGAVVVVRVGVGPADYDQSHVHAIIGSWSWTLPSKRAYLSSDTSSVRLRNAYVASAAAIFAVLGDPPDSAAANARRVLAVETALARADRPDDNLVTSSTSLAELQRDAKAFDWRAFTRGLGRPDLESVMMQPKTLARAIDSLAAVIPPAEWRPYLRWRLVLEMSAGIGGVRRVSDDFLRRELRLERPRAITCVLETTRWLAGGIGQAFVARTFPPEARSTARELTVSIRTVLRELVAALEWIGTASRAQLLAKLDSLRLWIGYPDRWLDYRGITLRDGEPTANVLTVRRFEMDRRLATIGKPVDRDSWEETNPAIADGSYYSNTNALVITAGELLPPFFDPRGEPAANFGKIAQVMGHELTHAMHSHVRLTSETGPRRDAWTPGEISEFTRRATPLIEQYTGYLIGDSLHVNGRRTLQENIADIGGLTLAWLAYQRAIQGKPRELIDGFTPEQRFFIAYAQSINSGVWGPEELRSQAQLDGFAHSPPKWRINGPLANLAAFAAAFGCKAGDPMVRPAALQWSVW